MTILHTHRNLSNYLKHSNIFITVFNCLALTLNMASGDEAGVAALVYDYLLKYDASLAQIFQKETTDSWLENGCPTILEDDEEAPKPAAKKVAAPAPATQKRKHEESSEDSSDWESSEYSSDD
jgi:hypothetical protein